jgi:flavin-dependent thymidylate synthase
MTETPEQKHDRLMHADYTDKDALYPDAYDGKSEVVRWADRAMYPAKHDPSADDGELVHPRVTLVYMTPDPLRVMASAAQLYAGHIIRNPDYISRSVAERWFEDMTRTRLQAPLEFIDLHFFFEGVTRAFTHQLVRQRTAVYVQESQRFAVKDNAELEVALPPSLQAMKEDDPRRVIWEHAVQAISEAYMKLVNAGVPAEDARGLLPTNITTRVHYKTNLRNLAEHAGNRLCSQAQAEWKEVWSGILTAILGYGPSTERWQQMLIRTLFKPICYTTGKCEFMAETDRYCRIRERIMVHYQKGEGPELWSDIDPREALLPDAARIAP